MADPGVNVPDTPFTRLARTKDLKDKTIAALLREDYDNEGVLSTIEDRDIEALKTTRGQRGMLKKWVAELQQQPRATIAMGAGSSTSKSRRAPSGGSQTLKPAKSKSQTKHSRMHSLPGNSPILPSADRKPGDGQDLSDTSKDIESMDRTDSKPNLVITELNIEECLKELHLGEEATQQVRDYVLENGVEGLDSCLKDKLEKFMQCKVNIAIIGRSGTGKSSLINSLRNMHAREPGAAPVGSMETTMIVTPYSFPRMEKAVLWDLPGVNTPKFPRASYLKAVTFSSYDAVIIVSTERFTEDDLWLATEAKTLLKPFFFLRTKIDVDVESNRRDDDGDDEKLLMQLRKKIQTTLHDADLPDDRVYLISNIRDYQSKWDYPDFVRDLLTKTPERNKYAMVLAMVSCSREVIEMKNQELSKRIDIVVLKAILKDEDIVQTGDTDNNCEVNNVITDEIRLYTERLGVTRADLAGVNQDKFDDRVKDIISTLDGILNNPVEECTLGRRIGIWFLGIGYFIGKWIDSEETKKRHRRVKIRREQLLEEAREILRTTLDKCVELAYAVLDAKKFL